MTIRPLLVLVRKDLQLFFQDRRAVILSFAVPLILASFFAIIFGGGPGGSGGGSRLTIRVADLDGSELSRRIVEAMSEDESLDVEPGTADEARDRVRRGKVVAAVVIPPGFGEQAPRAMFGPGPKPELTLLHDPTHAAEAAMVRGLMTQHVMEAVAADSFGPRSVARLRDQIGEIEKSDLGPTDKAALLVLLRGVLQWQDRQANGKDPAAPSLAGRMTVPFETKDEAVTVGDQNAKVAGIAHAFGGMAVQFLLFASIESGIGLLTERQRGLWKRLRAAPVPRWALLMSKGLSMAIIALMILAVIFLFGAFVFHLRIVGSAVGFGLVALSFAFCAASFGLLIAALGKTPQAARGLSAMAVLVMVMLGGAWVPTFIFPTWLQKVTPLLPTRWAVDGFDATLARGFSLAETLPIVLALLGFAGLFSLAAAWRFRWEEPA
ncbi:MAG TPA: ABC transporter permease [Isosphaeraceae bacterium]|jgi:ABC-2 type transport system permease protein